jgi:hypothetical protein
MSNAEDYRMAAEGVVLEMRNSLGVELKYDADSIEPDGFHSIHSFFTVLPELQKLENSTKLVFQKHPSPAPEEAQHLFAYATLQTEAVHLSTFGRKLEGNPDALLGYRLVLIPIENHRNLEFTGSPSDVVEGTVFNVTKTELEKADAYEPAGYKRTMVQLRSGLSAWVYSLTV